MSGGGDNDDATAFDLTALMDILSNIIFFLMASFGAAVVAQVSASVPTISESGESDVARDKTKVTVTMKLAADGAVDISAANAEIDPADLAKFDKRIPGKEGTVSAEAINQHLADIKREYRASKDIILVPDDEATYALIIEAMDASREMKKKVGKKNVYPELFPAVVVSSQVR